MERRAIQRASATLLLAAASCGGQAAEAPLIVYAAASTTDVVTALARSFDAVPVVTSFGSSSGLARQIEDGAPAGVFVSADARWVEALAERDLLAGEPRAFCVNRLVCVAAPGAVGSDARPANATELAARLGGGDLVAIADAGVPAGDYARQSLSATGDLECFAGRVVGQVDVRAVLRAVESGEATAGFVYATDARAAAVDVLFELDPSTHDPIEYVAAVVRGGGGDARAFLDHLTSPASQAALRAAGFEIAPR